MSALSGTRPFVLGVAGGTGSGKTTVAHRLAEAIPGDCAMIEHDAYYRDLSHLDPEQRETVNFDHPDALESDLLARHLSALRDRQSVDVPRYDYVTHTRSAEFRRVEPAKVIVVEGILVLAHPAVREQLDVKVFVDTDADIRVLRRIRRDLDSRGRTFAAVRDQYYRTVRPMHLEFVEPSKRWADLIIPEGGENSAALDVLFAKLHQVAAIE